MQVAVSGLTKKLVWTVFIVSEASMVWWAFVWPLAVDDDPANPVLQVGSLITLFAFLAALTALLVLRNTIGATTRTDQAD